MAYKFTNIKERALHVAKIHEQSYQDFCAAIGMSYASFKGSAKNRPLNSDAIGNILTTYPKINAEWLLTGAGPISPESTLNEPYQTYKTSKPTEKPEVAIPLYRLEPGEALADLLSNASAIKPIDSIKIPNIQACDAALYITGNAMSPLLKTGDIVAYKQITDFPDDIFWGELYVLSIALANEEYISVNQVQKSELGVKYIKLLSQNEQFEPKDIPLRKLRAMARIKAIIRVLG
ncbi:hypothetical protein ESY86_08980 [Subsaximicrobium wynnwilliamsii]|uniref:Peptidase S24/S26A/S26B/S26C domain-containing protein n=1 Tax=Subsaximicrobium wynnwilliamsii TaxID=291179 RepID=A0A5C6ZJE6_9FLAO|nr:S24 family peptidase [Subsaximicrobium wynnwilliamsii]TXD83543.1 hypothetical protein ESY87_09830 [Subsaximicrobium wynnwilliamsii]TXD89182.1 hypothetical protein ESY86_08980 [Subsaximicrobium wynnwilliamsii]TXE03223.1 hypothetical protein ESY88_09540 [Subsaximicrobium wynnwilliamsii]